MKATHTGTPGKDWFLADGQYTFSGPPRLCRGELTLINDSDNKVKVRILETRAPARKRKGMQALEPQQIQLSARIPPHDTVRKRVNLKLPPGTPPGLYQATIPCGDRKTQITIEVHEYRKLRIEPKHLRVQGNSGDTISPTVVLRNLGNTPIAIDDVAMVWLREQWWIGRTLVYTLRDTGPEDTYEDFANRLLHSFRKSIVSPARIRLGPESEKQLAPGQSLTRKLTMTLPKGLRKGRRYLGFIKVNEEQFWLELYCGRHRTPQPEMQPGA